MNYAVLKAEILLPAYDGMTDAQIADALNAETIAVKRDVPVEEARGLLLPTGEWGAITLLARQTVLPSDPMAPAVIAAITAIDTLDPSRTGNVEASIPQKLAAVETMLTGLISAGVLSTQTRDALLGLADVTVSRAQQLGLPPVAPGDVQTARGT